ncbi:hypothetical protein ACGFYU_28815 [Streptomyces sp. NPDC048337]
MAADEPVVIVPYDTAGWEYVYQQNRDAIEDPPCFSATGCTVHERPGF